MITTASGASDPATRRAAVDRSLEMIEGACVIAEALQDGGKLAVDLAPDVVVRRHGVERLAIARRRLLQATGLPQIEGGFGGHDGVARSSNRIPAGSLAATGRQEPGAFEHTYRRRVGPFGFRRDDGDAGLHERPARQAPHHLGRIAAPLELGQHRIPHLHDAVPRRAEEPAAAHQDLARRGDVAAERVPAEPAGLFGRGLQPAEEQRQGVGGRFGRPRLGHDGAEEIGERRAVVQLRAGERHAWWRSG